MALDFPNSPTGGQTYTGPGGIVWAWDGAKWANGVSAASAPYAPINSPVLTGDPQAPTPATSDNDTSIATTAYVKAVLAAAGQTFYCDLTDAADVATYKRMLLAPSTHGETSASAVCTGTTTDFLIASFITDPGVPGAIEYPAGSAYRRLYGSVSGGAARFRLQVYSRTVGGVETLARDEVSNNFTDTTATLQEWLATPAGGATLAATDRIVVKVSARRISGPTNVTVTLYSEGTAHASQVQTTISLGSSTPISATPPLALTSGNLTIDLSAVANTNYADNTGFAVNQRAYVSGTALAAGAFGHDRWKAGAGGCTYTFAATAGPSNAITITAGTLQQVVEGLGIAGGNYRLSWTGTAQGRVGAGSYAASPVSVAGITAGTNTTIEFNTGTLGQVKFEAGTVVTPWQARDPQDDLAKCQRFYVVSSHYLAGSATAGVTVGSGIGLPVAMRVPPPTVVWTTSGSSNIGTVTAQADGNAAVLFLATPTSTAGFAMHGTFTATADL